MTDLDSIKQIEKELNVKLEKLDKIEWNSRGYTVNQNEQVTGLGLYACWIISLKRIIAPLSALPKLTQLDLGVNQLSDLTPLSALPKLTQLNLSGNQLRDLSPLNALPKLTLLKLSRNRLKNIFSLEFLRNLIELTIESNQLSDISPLKKCVHLKRLDLYGNQIRDISPLENLFQLKTLILAGNQIYDISPLKGLNNLTFLAIGNNQIEELPPWIIDFDMEIRWEDFMVNDGNIYFYNNPLKSPPPEIVKQGKRAVRNYFEQLREQEEDYLFEAKMLIVGEPGAGKTSMAWKMEDADCDLPKEEETTRGIDVKQYYFPLQKEDFSAFKHPEKLKNRHFRLNLWDFGGQEIYKATHRFFLSKRSLYALVADSRNEDTDFNYWLHIVEMFGGDSPLLIVLNEKYQRKRNLDVSAMRTRFTNISEVLDVDFAEQDKSRLHKLERAVKYYVSQLPHIGSPVPAKWTDVREALEQDKCNTISLQDYLSICKENGIPKRQDALVLSQYFHDIGVFLHFQDDELLHKTIFLKPNWATHAVYKILDHPLLNQQHGRFNKADANTIWCEDEYAFLCNELLRLMQKFFLTYQIDHSGEYIVPERLLAKRPEYPWDDHDNLVLQYAYEIFMPRGILSQFTVQMHRYISNHDYVWKRGVVLERDNTSAEIIESYDARSINIRIAGKHKRDFMTIITEQFDQIKGQYERMNVDKLIPCNCVACKSSGDPHFFEYKKLKRRIEKGQQEVQCEESYKIVNVRSLIDDVINPALRGVGAKEILSQQENRQPEQEVSAMLEEYVDFELHIAPNGHVIANSPEGQATADIINQAPNDIQLALQLIEQRQTNADLLKQVGQSFYGWLFPETIHTHFHQTEAVARAKKSKIRLRLRIEAKSIASLPLEFLYRTVGGYFLAINPDTVLSRYLNLPLPPERVRRREGPLHILAIIADPTDQTRLNPDEWEAIIQEALAEPLKNGQMTLQTVKRATRKEIRNALLQQKPDIIQFVGHGIYQDGKGYLALVDEKTNKTWLVDDERFANLYLGYGDNLGLISLATCESAKSDNPQAFLGIAPQLVQRGIPAVVAMQYVVYIKTAKVFLEDFYTAVAARKPIDWAVQSARNAVSLEFGLDNREFATPVLYMRAKDGDVF